MQKTAYEMRISDWVQTCALPISLLKQAAENVVRPAMELGGNAPFIVFEDADIEDAVAGAMIAKMRNMGEACTAANRFYVHSSVGEAFSTRLAERMAALKMGNGLDEEEIGRASCRERVCQYV